MAVIEKIRSKAGLLIGIVAVGLVAFILGDFLTSNRAFRSGGATTVGEISGQQINVQDFEAKVQTSIENYKLNNNTQTVDQNTTEQIREQTWNQLVNEVVMGEQYKKLGIKVSAEELFDLVKGKDPHQQIKQAFTDPKTGQFNPGNVINFLKNMDNDPTGKTRAQWLNFEKFLQEDRMQSKYNELIKGGVYVSSTEAKSEYLNRNRTASIRYIVLPYGGIPDSTIEVPEADLKTTYNATQKKYKQVASRSIEYVQFDVTPSADDRATALKDAENMVAEFASSVNDSLFAAQHSDIANIDMSYHKKGSLSFLIDSIMFNNPQGFVYGPYEENNAFKLSKVSAIGLLPDSVKARHILLKVDNPADHDQIAAKADSIKNVIKSGMPFEIMAMQFSTDDGSKIKGGDLGWFGPGMMVKPFNDACFEGKKGDMPIVTSQFGIHLIEITDQGKTSRQIRVISVERKIEAGSKTYQAMFRKANEFASASTTAEAFDKAIKDQNLNKQTATNINENAKQVGALDNSRELVRWSFNAKVNEISKAFEFNNRFVIAKLTEIREKGIGPLEQVQDQVMAEARKDIKAGMLIKKLSASTNLDQLAPSVGQTIQTADNVSFSAPYLGNNGMEGNVVGHLMTMKPGTVSKPLKGMNGVYVIQVVNINEPQPAKDVKDIQTQIASAIQGRSQYEVFNALREKADVQDNRAKFY